MYNSILKEHQTYTVGGALVLAIAASLTLSLPGKDLPAFSAAPAIAQDTTHRRGSRSKNLSDPAVSAPQPVLSSLTRGQTKTQAGKRAQRTMLLANTVPAVSSNRRGIRYSD